MGTTSKVEPHQRRVLRHGLLSNAVIMTDWSETTFERTYGFDIDAIAEAENVLTVDMLYTEYRTISTNSSVPTWTRT